MHKALLRLYLIILKNGIHYQKSCSVDFEILYFVMKTYGIFQLGHCFYLCVRFILHINPCHSTHVWHFSSQGPGGQKEWGSPIVDSRWHITHEKNGTCGPLTLLSFHEPYCHYSDIMMNAIASKITGDCCSTVCSGADQRNVSIWWRHHGSTICHFNPFWSELFKTTVLHF